jgi:hypothetical protein
MAKMKGELIKALTPTEDTIKGISSNPELMAAFEDPEVMAAVDEISKVRVCVCVCVCVRVYVCERVLRCSDGNEG